MNLLPTTIPFHSYHRLGDYISCSIKTIVDTSSEIFWSCYTYLHKYISPTRQFWLCHGLSIHDATDMRWTDNLIACCI